MAKGILAVYLNTLLSTKHVYKENVYSLCVKIFLPETFLFQKGKNMGLTTMIGIYGDFIHGTAPKLFPTVEYSFHTYPPKFP